MKDPATVTATNNSHAAAPSSSNKKEASIDLLRRFHHALIHDEDSSTALRAYTCTRSKLQEWKREEEEEKNQKSLSEKRERELSDQKRRKSLFDFSKKKAPKNFGSDKVKERMGKLSSFAKEKMTKRGDARRNASNGPSFRNHSTVAIPANIMFQDDESSNDVSSSDDGDCHAIGILEEELYPSAPLPETLPADECSSSETFSKSGNAANLLRSKMFKLLTSSKDLLEKHIHTNGVEDDDDSEDLGDVSEGEDTAAQRQATEEIRPDPTILTPLHIACRLGHAPLVRVLLSRGGDLNVRDGMRRTSLHHAAGGIVGVAPPAKADGEESFDVSPGIPNPFLKESSAPASMTSAAVLSTASQFFGLKKPNHAFERISPDAYRKSFPDCSEEERIETIRLCMCQSIPINSVDYHGRTALHYAAELGRDKVCDLLIAQANVILTIVDKDGKTPCELAGQNGFESLSRKLESQTVFSSEDDFQAGAKGNESCLTMPFSWFETRLSVKGVREDRIEDFRKGLLLKHGLEESCQEPKKRTGDEENPKSEKESEEKGPQDDDDQKETSIAQCSDLENAAKPDIVEKEVIHMNCAETDEKSADNDENEAERACNMNDDKIASKIKCPEAAADDDNDDENLNANTIAGVVIFEHQQDDNHEPDLKKPCVGESTHNAQDLTDEQISKFLAFHRWEVDKALKQFLANPTDALSKANIQNIRPDPSDTFNNNEQKHKLATCLICCEEYIKATSDYMYLTNCQHAFCIACLGDYLTSQSDVKAGLTITCPHHECRAYLSRKEIQTISDTIHSDLFTQLTENEDEHFIATASDFSFCPFPNCPCIVQKIVPDFIRRTFHSSCLDYADAVCTRLAEFPPHRTETTPRTYQGVLDPHFHSLEENAPQPPSAHRFCFSCKSTSPHFPITCTQFHAWNDLLEKQISTTSEGNPDFEETAMRLWLKANTRACPKCKTPIEKDDGCNHMTCINRNCQYEFCWICRKDWKLHSGQTGGYFRCNRWVEETDHEFYEEQSEKTTDVKNNRHHLLEEGQHGFEAAVAAAVEQQEGNSYGSSFHNALIQKKKSVRMARFLHHYSRWMAHRESAALEEKMGQSVNVRLGKMFRMVINNGTSCGLALLHSSFSELLECRSFLQHSYAFSYLRYHDHSVRENKEPLFPRSSSRKLEREKRVFEQLQSDLEIFTESMSDIIARQHLRANLNQGRYFLGILANKRREVSNFIMSVQFVPATEKKQPTGKWLDLSQSLPFTEFQRLHQQKQMRMQYARTQENILINGVEENSFNERITDSHELSDFNDDNIYGDQFVHSPTEWQEEEELEVARAIRESIQVQIEFNEGNMNGGSDHDDQQHDGSWECGTCTYRNNGGGRVCAMCAVEKVN